MVTLFIWEFLFRKNDLSGGVLNLGLDPSNSLDQTKQPMQPWGGKQPTNDHGTEQEEEHELHLGYWYTS